MQRTFHCKDNEISLEGPRSISSTAIEFEIYVKSTAMDVKLYRDSRA